MFNPKTLLRRLIGKPRRTTGNYALPKEMQQEIMAKAEAKRQRKMARRNGWNGG